MWSQDVLNSHVTQTVSKSPFFPSASQYFVSLLGSLSAIHLHIHTLISFPICLSSAHLPSLFEDCVYENETLVPKSSHIQCSIMYDGPMLMHNDRRGRKGSARQLLVGDSRRGHTARTAGHHPLSAVLKCIQ